MSAASRNAKIAALIRDHGRAHNALKETRTECVRIVVEQCGVPQGEAVKIGDIVSWLDGFLTGQGIVPGHRSVPALEVRKPRES